MDSFLDSAEVRALGALIEKEIATPEYYPLTLNALVNACNQKSNRDPVVEFDEPAVEQALDGLRKKKLAATLTGAGIRVPKHRQLLSEGLNLGRRELALMCELMLRGPQTVGELHSRAERLHRFDGLEEVESCLQRLIERQPDPLVVRLPRQQGTKEPRYAHLLSGEVSSVEASPEPPRPRQDRFAALEAEISLLRREVEDLKQQLADFRRQFE
ncbi:MAG: YceH family protein [Bryobacteraceae bacterium]